MHQHSTPAGRRLGLNPHVRTILDVRDEPGPVVAFSTAQSNADLVTDVVRLGHLSPAMVTLDPTWGLGRFWTGWRPDRLVGSDLDPRRSPVGFPVDFTDLPWPRCFDAVVFDPPYKLNGTGGSHASDPDYGVATRGVSWQDRHALIVAGIEECVRVLVPGGTLAVKCQDQVCGGAKRWQTRAFADAGERAGCVLVDQLHLYSWRPQPELQACRRCRRSGHEPIRVNPVCTACGGSGWFRVVQRNSAANYSTLLVFRKPRHRGRGPSTALSRHCPAALSTLSGVSS
jgi:hypothetical protein